MSCLSRINVTHRFALCMLLCLVGLAGCNRATMRIPGASTEIVAQRTTYVGSKPVARRVVVALPTDQRASHLGRPIGGTDWTACTTDSLSVEQAKAAVQRQLAAALSEAKLFSTVSLHSEAADDIVLQTEMQALCSQVRGFIVARAAGIVALRITLSVGSHTLMQRTYERVVTDDQKEYSGSQITTIEQAMRVLISDSLREIAKQLAREIDDQGSTWKLP